MPQIGANMRCLIFALALLSSPLWAEEPRTPSEGQHGVLNPDSAFHFYHYVMTRGEELGAVPNACPGPEIEEESDYSLSDEADDSFLSRMSEITDD